MRWLEDPAGGGRHLFNTMGAFQRSEGLCHSKFFFSTPSRPLKCPHCIDISIPIWTTCQMLLAVVKVIDMNVTSRVDFELCLFTSSRGPAGNAKNKKTRTPSVYQVVTSTNADTRKYHPHTLSKHYACMFWPS